MKKKNPRVKRSDLLHLRPDQLGIEEGLNVRIDYGNMEELRDSLIQNGVQIPLRGYKKRGEDTYTVRSGHRRLKAALMAAELGHDMLLPFITETNVSREQVVVGMIVHNDGKQLTMLEKASAFTRLANYGWTEKEIATKVGKSETHVKDCLVLAGAGSDLRELIASGVVSSTAALEELKDNDSAAVVKKVKEVARKKVTKKTGKPAKRTGTPTKVKVSSTDLGKANKKFSTSRLRQVYLDVEKASENDELFDKAKVDLFAALLEFVEGTVDYKDLVKKFWINE